MRMKCEFCHKLIAAPCLSPEQMEFCQPWEKEMPGPIQEPTPKPTSKGLPMSFIKSHTFYEMIFALVFGTILTLACYLFAPQFGALMAQFITAIPAEAGAPVPVWLGYVDFIAVALNFACVWLTARFNITAWPIGILACIFLGFSFMGWGLYSSMALNLIYFLPIQFLGWLWWTHRRVDGSKILASGLKTWQWNAIGVSAPFIFLAIVMLNMWFGGVLPFLDTSILAISVVAQYLLVFKKDAAWPMWITVNVLSVFVYITAGANLIALQYALFLLNAIYGYYVWNRSRIA